jgi:rod shape-determining protein MreC
VYFNIKKPHWVALGLVVVVTLVLLKLPSRTAAQVKLAISSLFLPLFGLAGAVQQGVDRAGQALAPRQHLLQELEQLRRENVLLRARVIQAEEIARENARLRQALGWAGQMPWRLRLARVIARDPADWWFSLRIDAGLRQGITTNCPVLSPEGYLVGRVTAVGLEQSQVVLVGDPDCRVAVMVEETRDTGILTPSSARPFDNVIVELRYLPGNSALHAGQRVWTSGLGGIFPKGILVGTIVDFRQVDFGLYTEARVKLAARLSALEEVYVLLP